MKLSKNLLKLSLKKNSCLKMRFSNIFLNIFIWFFDFRRIEKSHKFSVTPFLSTPLFLCNSRLEMRMRFMPQSVYELQATDSSAFVYLHEQVVDEFFSHVAWRSSVEVALEVAALKVCRDFAEHQHKWVLAHPRLLLPYIFY